MPYGLTTPRQALREINLSRRKPWWAQKMNKQIVELLEGETFKGKPLIDTPMSEAAIFELIKHAIDALIAPAQGDPIEQMIREMAR